jgi:nitrous oxide reductase
MRDHNEERQHKLPDSNRRRLLGNAAWLGVAGVGAGLIGCKQESAATAPAGTAALATNAAQAAGAHEIKPGQLDRYYGLWSGGHSGEVRVVGLPSGREIKRIPVFNRDAMKGFHGIFPDKRDPVDAGKDFTTRVFCGAEFAIPLPNIGKDNDPKNYGSLLTCVDADTMRVRWQVRIDGNCDWVWDRCTPPSTVAAMRSRRCSSTARSSR